MAQSLLKRSEVSDIFQRVCLKKQSQITVSVYVKLLILSHAMVYMFFEKFVLDSKGWEQFQTLFKVLSF